MSLDVLVLIIIGIFASFGLLVTVPQVITKHQAKHAHNNTNSHAKEPN